ncbi:hypothetical protein OHB01_16935 [Microbispora hainanensis]|uniref:hypothetical protein n=1 Tax=Microbispora hainanensis TaxID=568844 RepID=UPI002E2DF86A|nr:hypothetical protein [Microbispora hainanensis]
MTGFDIHFQALESCRTAVRKAWGQYESLHGGLPETPGARAADFGHVDGAAALAAAVDTAYSALTSEAADARTKLKGVERALETVQDNVRTANEATSTSMRA